MAVFGAPVAMEDHAIRACLAALGIQDEGQRLAVEVHDCDGVDLRLRVGLNSGQVIAGEIGSGALGYPTNGEQRAAALGTVEFVQIKGAELVPVHRLLGIAEQRRVVKRVESKLVGWRREMSTTGHRESHTSQVPFRAAARLMRAATGVDGAAWGILSNRSSHSGLACSISAVFHARSHFFSAFSRAIASTIVGACSAYTSLLRP